MMMQAEKVSKSRPTKRAKAESGAAPEGTKRMNYATGDIEWSMVPSSKGGMYRAQSGEDSLMVERAGRRLGSFSGFVNGRKVGTWKGHDEAMEMTTRAYLRFVNQSKQAAELRELQPSMTWSSTLPILLHMLETTQEEKVRAKVREQLERMAKAADLAVMQKGNG
jgi:hypothetical protein